MRLDKFLKNSRLIKRRTVAKEACDNGKIILNEKVAKAGDIVKVGDEIKIIFGEREYKYSIMEIIEHPKKDDAEKMTNML